MVSLGPNVVAGSVIFLSGPIALPRSTELTLNGAGASTDGAGATDTSGAGGGGASSFFLQPNSARQPTRTRVVVRWKCMDSLLFLTRKGSSGSVRDGSGPGP